MGIQSDKEKIDQFKRDVDVLGHSNTKIAEKMGMEKGNFSNYIHENITITENFLKKFYDAWGDEINAKYEERKAAYPTDPSPQSGVSEDVPGYPEKNYRDDFIEFMQKNYTALVNNLDKVTDSNYKLVASNEKLVESNQKLVEVVLGQSKKKTGNKPSAGDASISQKEVSPKKSRKKREA